MYRITTICFFCLVVSFVFCGEVNAEGSVVESDTLIRQLQKQPHQARRTRGFVVGEDGGLPEVQQNAPPSATIYVYFISGTVDFADEQSKRQLDELGQALTSKSLEGARFEISGHTDSVGSESYNMNLSKRRAETVNVYLKEHFGYSSSMVTGYGETDPIASNETAEGRAMNRRVVITRLD